MCRPEVRRGATIPETLLLPITLLGDGMKWMRAEVAEAWEDKQSLGLVMTGACGSS
jgi:hypothetical protein